MNQYILTKNQTYIFETIEIIVLGFLVKHYYNIDKILFILFLIMLCEHLRQIVTGYRQKSKSIDDYITLIMCIFIFIYSLKNNYKISLIISILGILIHFITITTNKTFYQPIKIF